MFKNIYKNKKIIVTGHTGFKGSWLTLWLINMGAEVIGISKDIPTKPSHFELLNIKKNFFNYYIDLNNYKKLKLIINKHKPDFIFLQQIPHRYSLSRCHMLIYSTKRLRSFKYRQPILT